MSSLICDGQNGVLITSHILGFTFDMTLRWKSILAKHKINLDKNFHIKHFFLKRLGTISAQIGFQNLITLYHLNRNLNVCSIDMLKFHSIKEFTY
jgi:hypothetical protein